jgi:lipopolysaccharide biosynthesis glycosyltransferase
MKINKVKITVGFDQVEAVAYHTFCQSIIDKSSVPVEFLPLAINTLDSYNETHNDGSNKFTYSRFLTPYLNNFEGWAIFADGDMVCLDDIKNLWDLRDDRYAAMVVQHDYLTKSSKKYLGNKNENYPRKNWSSVILWNCGHPSNRILTPSFLQEKPGSFLHRFSWLNDAEIGSLPVEWNWLAIEYPENSNAKLIHYTLGTPCLKDYSNTEMASYWKDLNLRSQSGMGS